MRCGTAREWLTSAIDGELTARQRLELDAHLAGCPACAAERQQTARLLGALATLTADTALPPRLEEETLRRVRQLAAEEAAAKAEREPAGARVGRWLGFGLPALAAAAVVVLALRAADPPAPTPGPVASVSSEATREPAPPPPSAPAARKAPAAREKAPVAVARPATPPSTDAPAATPGALALRDADPSRGAAGERPDDGLPSEPPPELIARPDLFRDLPILQNMEKLQNYDAIETTTLDVHHRSPNG